MSAYVSKRRWSDNDRRVGPLTYSHDKDRTFSVVIDSGAEESPGCCLRLRAFGHTLILELPAIINLRRRWVDGNWDDDSYWDEQPREYGFSLSAGFLQVFFGAQVWCRLLPWTQWRFHRFSLYGLSGEHFWTQYKKTRERGSFDAQTEMERQCPSLSFAFDDYDGERITVNAHIEEREWLFGKGWFKWLSWFRKPRVSRCLDLGFSSEVGREKGSWKGGTVGHAIEMLPGELHESAFRRYCDENKLTFVGVAGER